MLTGAIWMVVVGFIIAFILAFGIGANDVANSFGTSVGSKVLTLRQACFLASVFETLGAILIGAGVSDTIRKGIVDITVYEGQETLLMVGEVSALLASGVWLLIATFLKLPVSGTHSIVGATLGFTIVAQGLKGVNWVKIGLISVSWFVSPLLSGGVSAGMFWLIRKFILSQAQPLGRALLSLPLFYALTVFVNVISVFLKAPSLLGLDNIPIWGDFLISIGITIVVVICVRVIVVPWMRKKIQEECDQLMKSRRRNGTTTPNSALQAAVNIPRRLLYKYRNSRNNSSKKGEDGLQYDAVNGKPEPKLDVIEEHIGEGDSLTLEEHRNPPLTPESPQTPGSLIINVTESTPIPKSDHNGDDGNSVVESEPLIQDDDSRLHDNSVVPPVIVISHDGDEGSGNLVETSAEISGQPSPAVEITDEDSALSLIDPVSPGDDDAAATPTSDDGTVVVITTEKPNGQLKPVTRSDQPKPPDASEVRRALKFEEEHDRPDMHRLFSFLQILTASFGSFAHGGNDVSNAIGPVVALWMIYSEGSVAQQTDTPIWILLYGGIGISFGLWIWGRRVIKTMGQDLTPIVPSSGFTIELGSALTVLCASNIGIPISTTHCKVGSVISVGVLRTHKSVDWKLFRNIIIAWAVTLPITGGISAAVMAALQYAV